jgi:hypothetical protein
MDALTNQVCEKKFFSMLLIRPLKEGAAEKVLFLNEKCNALGRIAKMVEIKVSLLRNSMAKANRN